MGARDFLRRLLPEGFESKVIELLRQNDIEGSFSDGNLLVAKRDVREAKKILDDDSGIATPKIIGENMNELQKGEVLADKVEGVILSLKKNLDTIDDDHVPGDSTLMDSEPETLDLLNGLYKGLKVMEMDLNKLMKKFPSNK